MSNEIKNTLESLIEQTYKVEREYKTLFQSYEKLSASYENMQSFVRGIVESLGAALWVVDKDAHIVIQNTLAGQIHDVFKQINLSLKSQEIELGSAVYAVKITKSNENSVILATEISAEKRSARLVSMGAVAAHLSHEIRNPIGAVSLLTSTLLKRSDEKNRPLIEEIIRSLSRVERIIKATLLFTKGVKVNKQSFSLEKLKISCQNAIKGYDFSKEISFEFSGFEGEIYADFDLLDLVFSNFIFNGIDAIEENDEESGILSIKHTLNGENHDFEISDSGVKIDPKVIYEPFKTTKLKGNGLGLALSIEIINAHNGSLALQNEPKIFTISLPK